MKVLVSTHAEDETSRARAAEVRALVDALELHSVAEDPAEADAILFVESTQNKFRRWAETLRRDRMVRAHLERCFVRDGSDRPIPFLPGLYESMPRSRFDPDRVVAIGPWIGLSDALRARVDAQQAAEPPYLFSFRGFESHPLRAALTRFDSATTPVNLTKRFWDFDPSEEFRLDYLVELRNSSFVLCPRGLGPSTVRLYEAMELGRVPVILSNEWIAPAGPDWDQFSVRLPESEVDCIPSVLAGLAGRAEEMGRNARAAWEEWFQPGPRQVAHWLDGIRGLIERRPPGWRTEEISRSWSSHRFQWRHGIHPAQGLSARVRRAARSTRRAA